MSEDDGIRILPHHQPIWKHPQFWIVKKFEQGISQTSLNTSTVASPSTAQWLTINVIIPWHSQIRFVFWSNRGVICLLNIKICGTWVPTGAEATLTMYQSPNNIWWKKKKTPMWSSLFAMHRHLRANSLTGRKQKPLCSPIHKLCTGIQMVMILLGQRTCMWKTISCSFHSSTRKEKKNNKKCTMWKMDTGKRWHSGEINKIKTHKVCCLCSSKPTCLGNWQSQPSYLSNLQTCLPSRSGGSCGRAVDPGFSTRPNNTFKSDLDK